MDPSIVARTWQTRTQLEPARRPRDFVEGALKPVAALLVVVSLIAAIASRPWDTRMGAGAAGRALTAKVRNGGIYDCWREERGGPPEVSIPLGDVDYFCTATNRPILSGYWIGTDSDSITAILPAG